MLYLLLEHSISHSDMISLASCAKTSRLNTNVLHLYLTTCTTCTYYTYICILTQPVPPSIYSDLCPSSSNTRGLHCTCLLCTCLLCTSSPPTQVAFSVSVWYGAKTLWRDLVCALPHSSRPSPTQTSVSQLEGEGNKERASAGGKRAGNSWG